MTISGLLKGSSRNILCLLSMQSISALTTQGKQESAEMELIIDIEKVARSSTELQARDNFKKIDRSLQVLSTLVSVW